MFSANSSHLCSKPPTLCLVGGSIGELTTLASRWLQAGFQVHVLYCGFAPSPPLEEAPPITFSHLDEHGLPPEFQTAELQESPTLERSERVRHALEKLHRQYSFHAILFSSLGGLGFRAVQVKRAGLTFHDTHLLVRLDACAHGVREQQSQWPTQLEDLQLDYIERFAFEYADRQLCATTLLLTFRRFGWHVRPDALLDEAFNLEQLAPSLSVASTGQSHSLVTIALAHYNLGPYLPATLQSLAAQTYPNLEVIIVDDGSTDAFSIEVFHTLEVRYPQFRFVRQTNAGIGATRNRILAEARGDYFLPVDADNIASPQMVEQFVSAAQRQPDTAAFTCYFLAFHENADLVQARYAYAYRPAGGPHVLASLRNVYGDANALFRTEALRAVGGYGTERGTSNEDWEVFVKLINAGQTLAVVPDHLFYYRARANGFSQATNRYANHQRVLRQFLNADRLPLCEKMLLWNALAGFQQQLEQLKDQRRCLRYRLADRAHNTLQQIPFLKSGLKWLLSTI